VFPTNIKFKFMRVQRLFPVSYGFMVISQPQRSLTCFVVRGGESEE